MPLDPTERNVYPFLFQTGIRTVNKLVLALAIHDENITMVKKARTGLTVWTGCALPFEERTGTKAHRNNEFRLPTFSKQRLIIAMPSYPRFPSPVKVQVRSSRHISLSTPRLHRGSDSQQCPAPLSRLWPNSSASPIRI